MNSKNCSQGLDVTNCYHTIYLPLKYANRFETKFTLSNHVFCTFALGIYKKKCLHFFKRNELYDNIRYKCTANELLTI